MKEEAGGGEEEEEGKKKKSPRVGKKRRARGKKMSENEASCLGALSFAPPPSPLSSHPRGSFSRSMDLLRARMSKSLRFCGEESGKPKK